MNLFQYKNGNTFVTIKEDGTKIREYDSDPCPSFPESMDIKITNYCSLSNYCKWCHEASDTNGKHADLDFVITKLNELPSGVELAIGGGNPLDHPQLEEFLTKVRDLGIIANITVNQLHVKKHFGQIVDLIENDLIKGLGISYNGNNIKETKALVKMTNNVVFHVIAGVNTLQDLQDISEIHNKVLVLGYKQFRKGEKYFSDAVQDNIDQWYRRLPLFFKKLIISFDNLAITQLNLRRYFTDKSWETFYMGDDGTFTYYIDAVNKTYGRNSTSSETFDLTTKSIKESFGEFT